VTSGIGWVQQWGSPRQQILPGDVIWVPPDVKHWHGATATDRMSHIAITNVLNGKMVAGEAADGAGRQTRVVDWLEQVSETEYSAQA
jgi:quercetin dioxygenase-like cupin family protein